MVVQELDELVLLLGQVREVDEEPAAHVPLHALHLESTELGSLTVHCIKF